MHDSDSDFRVFIANLQWEVQETELSEFFGSGCGPIREAIIVRDRETGRSRGFGFISFQDRDAMERALELDGYEFQGRPLSVKIAVPRLPRQHAERG